MLSLNFLFCLPVFSVLISIVIRWLGEERAGLCVSSDSDCLFCMHSVLFSAILTQGGEGWWGANI